MMAHRMVIHVMVRHCMLRGIHLPSPLYVALRDGFHLIAYGRLAGQISMSGTCLAAAGQPDTTASPG